MSPTPVVSSFCNRLTPPALFTDRTPDLSHDQPLLFGTRAYHTLSEKVKHLQKHPVQVELAGPFPHIKGLFPGLQLYLSGPLRQHHVSFILSPDWKAVTSVDPPLAHCAEGEIDRADFEAINSVSKDFLLRSANQDKVPNKKVRCLYNSWVCAKTRIIPF